MAPRRRRLDASLAARVPIVGHLARPFARIAERSSRRVPAGPIALLPVALLLDAFDALDALALGRDHATTPSLGSRLRVVATCPHRGARRGGIRRSPVEP